MVVTHPYGTKSIVIDYIRNVGGLATDTVDKIMLKADNEAELFLRIDPAVGIPDDYKFHKVLEDFCECWSACRLHLMFGDPTDADYYCMKADKAEAELLANDPSLQTTAAGHVGVPLPKTFPSNPDGIKIIGNKQQMVNP
jgi:hypothetical protein